MQLRRLFDAPNSTHESGCAAALGIEESHLIERGWDVARLDSSFEGIIPLAEKRHGLFGDVHPSERGIGVRINPAMLPESEIEPVRDAVYEGQCRKWKSQK